MPQCVPVWNACENNSFYSNLQRWTTANRSPLIKTRLDLVLIKQQLPGGPNRSSWCVQMWRPDIFQGARPCRAVKTGNINTYIRTILVRQELLLYSNIFVHQSENQQLHFWTSNNDAGEIPTYSPPAHKGLNCLFKTSEKKYLTSEKAQLMCLSILI